MDRPEAPDNPPKGDEGLPGHTSWHLIAEAATGIDAARDEFAARYALPLRAYFRARWRGQPLATNVDDAVQEVFVDCFKEDGALRRADAEQVGGFRAFLYGVARMTARHHEQRRARNREWPHPSEHGEARIRADDATLSRVFDRAWARSIVQQAVARQRQSAAGKGTNALRRVEVLRLRFQEAMPLPDIAQHLQVERTQIYKDIARGKEEFERSLLQVLTGHFPETKNLAHECLEILRLLE